MGTCSTECRPSSCKYLGFHCHTYWISRAYSSQGGSAVSQIQAYGSSLVANPVWTNNIATLQSNVPPSVVSLFSPDPRYLIESLATASTTPDYLSSVPSGVISTFTSLASGPAKAAIDIKSYVDSLYMNGNQKVFSELATDLPQDVLSDAAADPLGFLAGLVVQSGSAPWVTAIPNSLQSQVASGVNHMLAIISSDIAAPTGVGFEQHHARQWNGGFGIKYCYLICDGEWRSLKFEPSRSFSQWFRYVIAENDGPWCCGVGRICADHLPAMSIVQACSDYCDSHGPLYSQRWRY